jgi:hypothetical protein
MKFRQWIQEKWYEHVEESRVWEGHEPTATQQEYFSKYKYWLKREYKHQMENNDVQ